MILKIKKSNSTYIDLVPLLVQNFSGWQKSPVNGPNQNMSSTGTEWPDSLGYRITLPVTTHLIGTAAANEIEAAVSAVPFEIVTDIGGTETTYQMRIDSVSNVPVVPGYNTISFTAHSIYTV